VPGSAPEDQVILARQYYIGQPQMNVIMNRLWLLYERLGATPITCTATCVNPNATLEATDTITLSSAKDGLLTIGAFDVQITGSCVNVTLSVPALTGIFSLCGWVFKVDEGGEVIENT
jgi:hypothetical protein